MKKLSAIIIAIALVLGMSQCKKQDTPITTNNTEDGMVYITVNVGDDGTKHEIYPGTGAYVFTNGDKLYVGNNGHYIGTLEYQNGAFSGGITSPSTADYLHFYFTGGKAPASNPTAGSTTSFTVDISDQSSKLPVLSYGHSTQKYTDANTTYSTVLRNKCGLVLFSPMEATSENINIWDLKTTATIDFATPGITPTDETKPMTLYSVSDSHKWAIILPQTMNSYRVSINGYIASSYWDLVDMEIHPNSYIKGITISMFNPPTGARFGLFTVNSNGRRVNFSQGNLQYQATSNTWRFADNQYDYMGTGNNSPSSTHPAWIDLFGWGTSGYDNKNPWMTSTTNTDYGDGENDISGTNYDWGKYNAISNGGNSAGMWRTLTKSELDYLLDERTDASLKYGFGKVGNTPGLFLLPDLWILPSGLSFTPGRTNWVNVYTTAQWALMEANGAIFLPAAGLRDGDGTTANSVSTRGCYWCGTHGSSTTAWDFSFSTSNNPASLNHYYARNRHLGESVRLVKTW